MEDYKIEHVFKYAWIHVWFLALNMLYRYAWNTPITSCHHKEILALNADNKWMYNRLNVGRKILSHIWVTKNLNFRPILLTQLNNTTCFSLIYMLCHIHSLVHILTLQPLIGFSLNFVWDTLGTLLEDLNKLFCSLIWDQHHLLSAFCLYVVQWQSCLKTLLEIIFQKSCQYCCHITLNVFKWLKMKSFQGGS